MSSPLESITKAFDKAIGPFRKRQEIRKELKEIDIGKGRRSALVAEAEALEAKWLEDLIELKEAMEASQAFQAAVGRKK